jgi:hypothetical protein
MTDAAFKTVKLSRFLAVLATILFIAQSASAQKTLTNDSIVRMSKAHLSTDVILNAIRTTPGKYSLDADDLITLKTAGVPDVVIAAMQKESGNRLSKSSSPTNQRDEVPSAPNGSMENWTVQKINDEMSSESYDVARTGITGPHGGVIQVSAHCENDLGLSLYLGSITRGMGFKRSPMSQSVIVHQGAYGTATGVASPRQYCATFRVKAGRDTWDPWLRSCARMTQLPKSYFPEIPQNSQEQPPAC